MATVNKDFVVKNGVIAGANVQGTQIVSTTSSLPPLTVTSSANVENLSVDYLDGLDSTYFLDFTNLSNKPDPTIVLSIGGVIQGSASATLTDLGDATLTIADIGFAPNSITLGVDTYGDYVEGIVGGTGVTVSASSGVGVHPEISIGQDVAISASPTFGAIYITDTFTTGSTDLVTNLNAEYLGGYTALQLIGMAGVQSVNGTANEIEVSASVGNIVVGLPNDVTIQGSLQVNENLIVTGSTVILNSTVVTVDDPIFTLGGTSGIDDGKDRGIEFNWNNGSTAKIGFFGYDESTGKFTFIQDATNTNEVFSGIVGEVDAKLDWTNLLNIPDTIIGVSLSGDVTGAASATLTDLGNGQISITTSVVSVPTITLGSGTDGNYVDGIYGTANQILVAGSGAESASVVLSLPQDISTTSTPTFAGVNLTHGGVTSASVLITANDTPTTIDSFATSSITSAEYFVQAKQSTKMTTTRVTVVWDGTDVLVSEHSIIEATAGAANLTFTATESSGTVAFTASSPDAASTNIDIKVVRTTIGA